MSLGCWLAHRWSKWDLVQQKHNNVMPDGKIVQIDGTVQQRRCEDCGLRETRLL